MNYSNSKTHFYPTSIVGTQAIDHTHVLSRSFEQPRKDGRLMQV